MTEPPNSPPEPPDAPEPAEPQVPPEGVAPPEEAEAVASAATPVESDAVPPDHAADVAPPAWVPPSPEPEPAPGVTFGGFWIRFVAYFVDVLIITLGLIPIVVVGFWNVGLVWIVFIAYLIWVVGYFVWFWVRGGSTPGMALFGLRVVRDRDGGPVSWGKGLVRYLGIVVSTMISYVGLIWVAFDQRKRGWHDLMAGTVVIRTPDARSTGGRRLLTIGGAALGCLSWIVLVIAFIAFGAFLALNFSGFRDSNGAISIPQTISVNALRVGDCFDLPNSSNDLIDTVDAKPCADLHVYEVFFTGDMPDGAFPGTDAQSAFAETNCKPAFETYVGVAYDDSAWSAFYIGPSEDTWGVGDRTVICQLHNADETPVTGSAHNSGR